MLMTKLTYKVEPCGNGCKVTVTRTADGAVKEFLIAHQPEVSRVDDFMSSVTDEQASDYFPKPRKQK